MILGVSEHLRYCDPGWFRAPGSRAPSYIKSGCRASTPGLLHVQIQTGRNPCHWLGWGSCVPGSWVTQLLCMLGQMLWPLLSLWCFRAPGSWALSGCCRSVCSASAPGLLWVQVQTVFLGVLELLGVEIPLGIMGLGVEPVPKVCSGHRLRLEGSHATGWVGFMCLWIQGSQLLLVLGQILWLNNCL